VADEKIFAGEGGYASLTRAEAGARKGLLLEISNPTSKVNTLPPDALSEIDTALEVVEKEADVEFVIFHGGEGRIHAGADVNMFAGVLEPGGDEPVIDLDAVGKYLEQGTALDVRIKKLSSGKTTVSIMHGERFGGSVEWPLMATYCVAESGTGIQLSEVNIGIIPGWDGVLNILLKAGPANALYMGATGARVDAAGMQKAGIVDAVVDSDGLMAKALELAGTAAPKREKNIGVDLVSENEIMATLKDRLDVSRYEALRNTVAGEKDGADPKELSKSVDKRIAELGKPCAPLAVEAVTGFLKEASEMDLSDPANVEKLAFIEARLCTSLMKTNDRVLGINSILKAREDVLNKIALFTKT